MAIFTYHLLKTSYWSALQLMLFPPRKVPGLIHAEWMVAMTLGAPVFSLSRMLVRQVAVFAEWESQQHIDEFLLQQKAGRLLNGGWHIRLRFLRQWGSISGFRIPEQDQAFDQPGHPVVAVTIARMKLQEVPRFLHWGRPVEKLVRDHPGTTLSLAAIRLPRTVSTFSIWHTQQQMTDMVRGHSAVPQPKRHIDAMKERDRKDFHFEFTTLRFQPVSEYGTWNGQSHYIPVTHPSSV